MLERFVGQVHLLVDVLPHIAKEEDLALKGGTAINLFYRDMPRLSVDIDLTYVPLADRNTSLAEIDAAMQRIAKRVVTGIPHGNVQKGNATGTDTVTKLSVRTPGAQIKLEVTPVLRGCVYEPVTKTVSARVEEKFGFAEMQLVSFGDLYAGKIVAALDRQHPRDFFDVRELLANEGIGEELRKAFIVYLMSHNRPMGEISAPTGKDISQEFERNFVGMTEAQVTLDELIEAREQIIAELVGNMPRPHKDMLLSFKSGEPDWSLLGIPNVENLSAVRWRLENLSKILPGRRAKLLERLKAALGES